MKTDRQPGAPDQTNVRKQTPTNQESHHPSPKGLTRSSARGYRKGAMQAAFHRTVMYYCKRTGIIEPLAGKVRHVFAFFLS